MSELIQKNDDRATIRWKLLTGASALALSAYISSGDVANAEDSNRPTVWIELGGQLNRLDDGQETFAPTLLDSRPPIFEPSQKFERMPAHSIDENGSIAFQPNNSDWTFSASVRYGRSSARRHVHQQTTPGVYLKYVSSGSILPQYPHGAKFADTSVQNSESHTILDFQAGKDVGLGLFGRSGSSVLSVGVRFAQFTSRSNIALKSDPDWHRYYKYNPYAERSVYLGSASHANSASLLVERSFRGVGPSISWSGSTPIVGNPDSSELTIDWGVNAALLFGKQKAKVHHQTTAQYHGAKYTNYHLRTTFYQISKNPPERVRSVTVPNVGGSLGISFKYNNAKISFGYRADFFFGAMDGGIDTAKTYDRDFYGPYAAVSIGLGG